MALQDIVPPAMPQQPAQSPQTPQGQVPDQMKAVIDAVDARMREHYPLIDSRVKELVSLNLKVPVQDKTWWDYTKMTAPYIGAAIGGAVVYTAYQKYRSATVTIETPAGGGGSGQPSGRIRGATVG